MEGQESAERLEKSVGGSAHQFGARGLQVGRHRGSSQEPGRSDPRGDGSLEGQRFGCGQIHLPQGRHGGFIRFCMDIQWLHLCHIIYYVSQSFIIDFNVCRYAMAWHNRNPMPLRFLRIGSSPSFLHLFLQVIKRFTLLCLRSAELLEFWLDMSHLGVGSEQHAQHAAVATFQRLRNLLMAVMNLEVLVVFILF